MTDLITAEEAGKLAHKYRFANNDLERVLCETARTVIALHAQLVDAQAAQALVVERAEEAVDAEWRRKVGLNCTEVCAIIRALAHPSGLAMLAELRAERDAAIGDRTMARAGREIAIADRDELRAAIFGSPDYAADLRNGNFREMAETLHSAQKGGIARAEKAEAERDRLAAANAALEARLANGMKWCDLMDGPVSKSQFVNGQATAAQQIRAALAEVQATP